MFRTILLHSFRLDFFHRGVNQRIGTFAGKLLWEVVYCVRRNRILLRRIFQIEPLILIHQALQIFFLHKYLHIYFHQGLNGHTIKCESFLFYRALFLFLVVEVWYFEKTNQLLLVLTFYWYSNKYFSITVELLYWYKVSIWSFLSIESYSIETFLTMILLLEFW